MSFKKIASLHHAPKRNTTTATTQTTHANNTHNRTLRHHKLGEKPKEATVSCAIVANAVPHQRDPLQTIAATRNSSTMGKSPSSHTHDHRSPSPSRSSAEHSRRSDDGKHWSWPLCMGASPLPPPRTPLPRTQISETAMRATPPSSRHRSHHRTMQRLKISEPMVPLHLLANTD